MSKGWQTDNELLPQERLRGVMTSLPRCVIEPSAVRKRLLDALTSYRINRLAVSVLPTDGETRRNATCIAGAAEKLLQLLRNDNGGASLIDGHNLDEMIETFSRLEPDLQTVVAAGRSAAEATRQTDEDPLRILLRDLVNIWTEATSERPRQPTYNPVTTEVSWPLIDFILVATGAVLTIRSDGDGAGVSMEAIRHRLRALLPKGERPQKNSTPRLLNSHEDVRTLQVTQAHEVTRDDQNTTDRSTNRPR